MSMSVTITVDDDHEAKIAAQVVKIAVEKLVGEYEDAIRSEVNKTVASTVRNEMKRVTQTILQEGVPVTRDGQTELVEFRAYVIGLLSGKSPYRSASFVGQTRLEGAIHDAVHDALDALPLARVVAEFLKGSPEIIQEAVQARVADHILRLIPRP